MAAEVTVPRACPSSIQFSIPSIQTEIYFQFTFATWNASNRIQLFLSSKILNGLLYSDFGTHIKCKRTKNKKGKSFSGKFSPYNEFVPFLNALKQVTRRAKCSSTFFRLKIWVSNSQKFADTPSQEISFSLTFSKKTMTSTSVNGISQSFSLYSDHRNFIFLGIR